jgi:hypothetical protein
MNTTPLNSTLLRMKMALLAVFFVLVSTSGFSQLSLITVSIPDTVVMNEQITVQFSVKNLGAESRLGNLQLEFLNSSNDSIASPLGGYENTLQFFAPQQTRDFSVDIDITPSFFIEGGNTVVIWPSMVTDPELATEPILRNIYVLGSTGIVNNPLQSLISLVNPVHDVLHFIHASNEVIKGNAWVYSISGQALCALEVTNGKAKIPNLPKGIYCVALLREDDQPTFFRFIHLLP